MASVEINNVYYNDDIQYIPEIADLFDHYAEGDRDGLTVTFRDLLDEQLRNYIDVQEDGDNMDTDDLMDTEGGVYDIYFHRGNLHVSCRKDYANLVVRGMRGILNYIQEQLSDRQLAEFCNIRGLRNWNRPKVGAVHEYYGNGIKRTTIDVYRPHDIDPISLSTFMEQEKLQSTQGSGTEKPDSFDGPPKALYHGRKRAPVQTEITHSKEGSAAFWKKLDLANKSPTVREVLTQLQRKKKKSKQVPQTRQNQDIPHSITPTATPTATEWVHFLYQWISGLTVQAFLQSAGW